MATTTFVDRQTPIMASWLNDVDAFVYQSITYATQYAVGDGVTNDTTTLQQALSAGSSVVDGGGRTYKITSSITVPAGVTFQNANITVGTAGINAVLVNTRSKLLKVKITGSGTTGLIERLIYPALDGVSDVELDVELTNATVGLHLQYLTSNTDSNIPKRWYGNIYVHDIIGVAGNSEGYGVLLSPGQACTFNVKAVTIARHAIYLSAGTRDCDVDLVVDGCANYAVQLYSTGSQATTQYNTVKIKAKNLTENVTGQSGAIAIVQNAHYNTVTIDQQGNGGCMYAALIEGSSGSLYPYGNKVINSTITGQFIGSSVIKMINADSTLIANNTINAYATYSIIGMNRTGTNSTTHAGFIEGNILRGASQAVRGIYNECISQPSYIGLNDIRDNSTSLRVDDQSGGKRTGFSRKISFSGTTASVTALSSGDTTITLADNLQTTARGASVNLTGASVQYFNKPFWASITSAPSDTTATLRIYNGHSADQTFTYAGFIEGD